jgi:phosphoribosylaminoimidazole-succinocarboxamide synthase
MSPSLEAKPRASISVPTGWKYLASGKVRDIYSIDSEALAFIASDRVSAFDWVLPTPIPDKGKILCQISKFWFNQTKSICKNHWQPSGQKELPVALRSRTMIVEKAKVYPFEFIVRGYLAGSLWKAYKNSKFEIFPINRDPDTVGTTLRLPSGLQFGDTIAGGPILTPTTKEKTPGKHDEDVSWEVVEQSLGRAKAQFVREKALEIFQFAHNFLKKRGIVLVDTKFEFGELGGQVAIVDEILTPDSSRFWWLADYSQAISYQLSANS